MAEHSKFGGSSADRWMNCPGSIALCATVPELPESVYAAEGTKAHGLAAYCLANGLHNVFGAIEPDQFPNDMIVAVQKYLDTVWAEHDASKDAELYVETTFNFPDVGDGREVYGSNDAIVYTPSRGRLVVFDYKHGVGVSVSAEDNAQLKFYAAGAYLSHRNWKVREIELVIVQPRARDVDDTGAVKRWPMATVDLLNFASEIEDGVRAAKQAAQLQAMPEVFASHLKTGSWCRWCDAAAVCPAREAEALKAMTLQYSTIRLDPQDLPAVEELANDKLGAQRIGEIMRGIEILTGWANQVREFAEAHMLAGTLKIPGWKVVDKIGRRRWTSAEEEIGAYLDLRFGLEADDIRPRKLVTLTEVEKQMKLAGATREEIDAMLLKFTVKDSSGQTIAPEEDRRPAINTAERSFSGVKI